MSAPGGDNRLALEDEKKPIVQSTHINIKVNLQGKNAEPVFFRIKRNTQLKKLMDACCDKRSLDMNAIVFLFDGRRFRAEQTPDQLEMEEGDEIDVMLEGMGGGI